ncbi:MAG: DUF1232 domain-containing protein [Rikenellaceae bacterium]|nr:DUF1232 domain-containing protein [Rikenellaceae bacterium]
MDTLTNILANPDQLWQYIKQYAVKAGREATRMVLELYYVVKAPTTPVIDKSIILGALAYQLLPKDLLSSKKLGVLGLADNIATLAVAYNRVKHHITPETKMQVEGVLDKWFGASIQ